LAEVLKTNNMGFKLKSGNKPSMARISGVEKISDYNKQQKQIYDEKLQEYNRKSKRYQNQKEQHRLYQRITKIADQYDDGTSFADSPSGEIYRKGDGLARQWQKLRRENRKLYREGDRRYYSDYVYKKREHKRYNNLNLTHESYSNLHDPVEFDRLFHPGEKPREPMYQAELNVKRLKNIDMGGTPTETIEYKGPEYFQHKIDDKNKQVYVRKDLASDIYGENAKDLKTTEDGAYVIVDYKERSKLQKLGDRIGSSVENLFNRGSRPRPKYRKNLVTGGTNVIM